MRKARCDELRGPERFRLMSGARIVVEPPLEQWHPAAGSASDHEAFAALLHHRPETGTAAPPPGVDDVIATGHQPWLWHPGILAKDIAAAAFARRTGGEAVHLVVDHDPLDTLHLDLPRQQGSALHAHTLTLHTCPPGVPPASLPPADGARIAESIGAAQEAPGGAPTAEFTALCSAWKDASPARTLAEQIACVLGLLRAPLMSPPRVFFSSALHRLPAFGAMLDLWCNDPMRSAALYNEAAAAHPEGQVTALQIGRDRIELPFWALRWQQPRLRVYAETDGGALVTETGTDVREQDDAIILAPKAITMMALLRSACCNFFVHGTGGARYDAVTDHWWAAWRGTPLAPRAMVTADLSLPFDAPVAAPQQLAAALWKAHHLPHNLDRVMRLSGPEVQRKRVLLETMNDDRDRSRRAAAFDEIHRINAALARRHGATIEAAHQDVQRMRDGMANRRIARRRDWCFALHDGSQLQSLARALEGNAIGDRGEKG